MNWRYHWNMTKAWFLRPYWAFRSKFTPTACDWVYPYGFVPECGCPVHDS
jgi:hypothetical protein